MAPQPSWRGERSLDGTQFVHEAQFSRTSMGRRGSSSVSSSKDDHRRPQGSSNRNNRPQLDNVNANLTANVNSPNNSKFQNKPNNPSSSPGNPPPFTFIQNNDPRVIYNGAWTLKGNKFVTIHSTTSPNASVSLKFNGTSIVVFGTVPKSNTTVTPPTAVFMVDSNPPVQTEAPTADNPIPNQPLFAVNPLSGNTEHEITITVVTAEAPFILESFFISTDSNAISTTNGTATTTEMSVNGTDVSAPYTSPSSSSSARSSEARAGLKVAAGILATLLVVIVLAAAFLLIRRRQTAQRRLRAATSNRISAFTSWTSTESILEATGPSLYNSNLSGRNSRRSDFPIDGPRVSYMTQASNPPPLPPKALLS